ncbi:TPA: hypothetical protein OUD13_002442 [Morganella morganii]|nr:hypothetical protein [Morganella morganii]
MASGLEKYLNDLAGRLDSLEVRAGFLEGGTYHDGTSIATVAYSNEYGSPGNNQPPRPFFRNAISENQDEWAAAMASGIKAGLDVRDVFDAVGAKIKGDIQTSIAEFSDPPLKESTLRARRTRKVMPNSSTKPLVDTRVMIGDVNYEVTDD